VCCHHRCRRLHRLGCSAGRLWLLLSASGPLFRALEGPSSSCYCSMVTGTAPQKHLFLCVNSKFAKYVVERTCKTMWWPPAHLVVMVSVNCRWSLLVIVRIIHLQQPHPHPRHHHQQVPLFPHHPLPPQQPDQPHRRWVDIDIESMHE